MADLFKKLLYAGVGLASQATDRFEQTIDELVEKGKISDTEGKKIIDEFLEKTEARREDFEDRFQTVLSKFDFVKREDVDELNQRIEDLEAQLNKTTKASKPKAAAKA